MHKVKIFFGNALAVLLAFGWMGGMFFSITKQLNSHKILQVLPLAIIASGIYGIVQVLGQQFISNTTAKKLLFLIPVFSLIIAGLTLAETPMDYYLAAGAIALAGYGKIMQERKKALIASKNGN